MMRPEANYRPTTDLLKAILGVTMAIVRAAAGQDHRPRQSHE